MVIEPPPSRGRKLGLVVFSFPKRWQGKYSSLKFPPFRSALDVLDHGVELGSGGLQIGVTGWDSEFARKVRSTCESYGVWFEGQVTLPRNEGDAVRFERDLRAGKEAGATVFRTATGGRRYELFHDLDSFKRFKETAWKSMLLAEPVARRVGVQIGIENHKDLHAAELAEMLDRLSSEAMGTCIDLGNSIALLEDPINVAETLAPWVVTTHVKDMAVKECDDGFLLAEVPLGQGMLDLNRMMDIILRANPRVNFALEMITRDPLQIPCLTPGYWATFPDKPGTWLARTLTEVRDHAREQLPAIKDKPVEEQLQIEEDNIRASLKYARETLGLG